MKRALTVLFALFAVVAVSSYQSYGYPLGTCSPATDLFWCLDCASAVYESCYTQCSMELPLDQSTCGRDCIITYRQDLADCHNQAWDPIVN